MSAGKHWSKHEDSILEKHYPTSSNKEILQFLPNRNIHGIRIRANRLHIVKQKQYWDLGIDFNGSLLSHLSESEKGYIAGIVDGEGCIRLSRHKTIGKNKSHIYHIQVTISNTSSQLLDWLENKIPGIAYHRKTSQNPKWKDCYSWVIAGNRRAIIFLKEIKPYLVIKKKQAELLSNGYVHLSDQERDKLYLELHESKAEN
jgi:hypothetical protein